MMTNDPSDLDAIVMTRAHEQTEKIEGRNPLLTIAVDEHTLPDRTPEHQPTRAEVIRMMTARFRQQRS